MAKKNDIAKVEATSIQPVEQIESLIITVRGKQVILDRDLARLYGVETKRLNEQVRRNIERFPEDFMFQFTKEEAEFSKSQIATLNGEETNLKSQIATSSENEILKSQFATSSWGGQRYLPYAFTENGIAMLSSVLRSPMAIATNIHIMRAFNAMRHFIGSHAQVFQRLEVVERNQLALTTQVAENNKKLEEVFKRLDAGDAKPEHGIFFDLSCSMSFLLNSKPQHHVLQRFRLLGCIFLLFVSKPQLLARDVHEVTRCMSFLFASKPQLIVRIPLISNVL